MSIALAPHSEHVIMKCVRERERVAFVNGLDPPWLAAILDIVCIPDFSINTKDNNITIHG